MATVTPLAPRPSPPEPGLPGGAPPGYSPEPQIDPMDGSFATFDRATRAAIARATVGISPAALAMATMDWAAHLAISPGKQGELALKAWRKAMRFGQYLARATADPKDVAPCIEPLPQDRRFRDPAWQDWPYRGIYQAFLLQQQWWHNATTGIRGVSRHHQDVVAFTARQLLDVVSPSNGLLTNPVVLTETVRRGGANLVQGWLNFAEDWERAAGTRKPVGADAFPVGQAVATTPGKVVFRNQIMELIQYRPATKSVHASPILIVPAWIMKYYILDLSPGNSLVKHLVDAGHTIFMISWKNPGAEDRDLELDDYRRLGIMAAVDCIAKICPDAEIQSAGYCLGGTLLAIAAAAMARDGDTRLRSVTLLAAQVDFTEAGELTLFIDESEVSFLEDMMWEQGFLDTRQMAGAFHLLRSNDLIWSHLVHDYLMGERQPMTDLMAWNADATRMPFRMHSEYLRRLFLENQLAQGRFPVDGRAIAVDDIRVPIFAVATEKDHVAPWPSVHKIHQLADTDVTFVLTNGGHNAGIVSEPGHPHRHYRIATKTTRDHYLDPQAWWDRATAREGSWWPAWLEWLEAGAGSRVAPPSLGAEHAGLPCLDDAPGRYVLQE
jgi:polyhydroxyalkanoate synthase